MKKSVSLAVLILAHGVLFGQAASSQAQASTATQQSAASAWSPSKDIGVFVFPRAGQSGDQQLKDEAECYDAAKQQSGIDPKAPPPATKSADHKIAGQKAAAESVETPKGGRVKGAARGAAGGAAIGAIAGDAGKGAGAGAVAGTMRGGAQQRQATAAAKQQAAKETAAKQQKKKPPNRPTPRD